MYFAVFFTFLLSLPAQAGPFDNLVEELRRLPHLVDVTEWDGLEEDIRYATIHNFTNTNVYGKFKRCFLHVEAAEQLKKAIAALARAKPKWSLLVFDCLRPRRAQVKLFEMVRGTPQEKYVVNPALGSVHNFGFALDISLIDDNGIELDMGSPYDFFGPAAEPRMEPELLRRGRLSKEQIESRNILRRAMKAGGFNQISTEWWHFDGLPGPVVREKYKIVE